jgi:hypothetical protein
MRVGTILSLKRECLGNAVGSKGVVFYDYGSGFQVIFENGNIEQILESVMVNNE